MPRHSWLALMLLLGPVACGSGNDADSAEAPAQTADAPQGGPGTAEDVASYELTMDRLDRFYAVQRSAAIAMKDLSPEERERLDPALDADASFEEMVRGIEANPMLKQALDDAGMSARDYAMTALAYIQAGMAAAVLEMRPNDDADSLVREMGASMENVEFMREHQDELRRKQEEMEAELRAMGVPMDDEA